MNRQVRKGEGEIGALILVGIIALIILVIMCNPVYFVQSGEKAVIKRFGTVNPEVISDGMHFKTPFIDSVIKVDVTPWTLEEEVQAYTKDNQPIDIKYNVIGTYPKDDVANTVIQYGGKPYGNFAQAKLYDALKAVAGKYTASEFVTSREIVKRDFLDLSRKVVVNEQVGKPSILIIDTPIVNIDFDDQYENAIKAKQVAQQKAQEAVYKLQQAKVDADASVAKAEGEAKALTITAQAIAKNPAIVKLEEVKKWNGNYPLGAKVIGGGATIVDTKE
jgi:regulator of protease activity HflC (stomatin/prohibitin superfamily)